MKNIPIGIFTLASAMLLSCSEKKEETTVTDANAATVENAEKEKRIDTLSTAVATGHAKIDTAAVESAVPVVKKVRGTVKEIQNGKDGYTATIQEDSGNIFYATISIPNMSNPDMYRKVAVGDRVTVKGEAWKAGDKMHIKVTMMD